MGRLHEQLKQRRKSLGLTQQDTESRVGMSRQRYNRLETRGNPRLDNLDLVAKGLKMELMLIPQEKVHAVQRSLDDGESRPSNKDTPISDDPWEGLLKDAE